MDLSHKRFRHIPYIFIIMLEIKRQNQNCWIFEWNELQTWRIGGSHKLPWLCSSICNDDFDLQWCCNSVIILSFYNSKNWYIWLKYFSSMIWLHLNHICIFEKLLLRHNWLILFQETFLFWNIIYIQLLHIVENWEGEMCNFHRSNTASPRVININCDW